MSFLGMRGSGNWVTDQRPKNWREMILMLYPNGSAPLTAILSKMSSQSVDDPEFNWWTKGLPTQRATITGVYSDALSTAITAAGSAAGTAVWLKMSAAHVSQFVPGKVVMLRKSTDYRLDTVAKVTLVTSNGANSYIKVSLLEADDNSATLDIGDADTVLIIGSMHAEGADRPSAIANDVTKVNNYTQIFRNSLAMTRTAQKTRLRTPDAYKEAKRECLELHSIEMEKAFIFGVASETIPAGGQPERTTMGILNFIKTYAAANCDDFSLNATYASKKWTDGSGKKWLNSMMEKIFRYGGKEKLALAGSGALLGLQELVDSSTHVQMSMTATTKSYGLAVTDWVTPFGTIHLVTHPLLSYEATNRNSMIILEPKNLKYRYIDDTQFKPDDRQTKGGGTGKDGKEEEFLTEAGLEMHYPETCAYLNGFGVDSSL